MYVFNRDVGITTILYGTTYVYAIMADGNVKLFIEVIQLWLVC